MRKGNDSELCESQCIEKGDPHIHYNKLFTQKVQHQAFMEKLDEFMESHNKEEENQDGQIPQE